MLMVERKPRAIKKREKKAKIDLYLVPEVSEELEESKILDQA